MSWNSRITETLVALERAHEKLQRIILLHKIANILRIVRANQLALESKHVDSADSKTAE
jgi:predicted ATP-grasp superfamily ATP-dependent carboligase